MSRVAFTRQQWLTIGVIGSVHLFSAITVSLQAPFYPQEAESKGATATEYGLVFGIFELTAFLSCPIFGKYLHRTGAKRTIGVGVIVAGLNSFIFGLLDLLKGHYVFIGLSLMVRVAESLGASAAITAAFAITAAVFPNSVATTFAALEMFYGVGFIVGPTLGGFLFVAGGYMLPFVVMGSCMVIVGITILIALPAPPDEHEELSKGAHGVFAMLAISALRVDALCIMAASSAMGFYAATLEPHLRQFQLTPAVLYTMFVLSGATYAGTAPLVGRLCDRYVTPRFLTLAGSVCEVIGALLVGPAAFIPLDPSLGLCITGLIFHGLGLALLLVSCFIDALRSATANGFGDNLATYGLVAGLWASSFSLGAFIGPSVAGVLLDFAGFRNASYFVLASQMTVLLVVLASLTCTTYTWPQKNVVVLDKSEELSSHHASPLTEQVGLLNDAHMPRKYGTEVYT